MQYQKTNGISIECKAGSAPHSILSSKLLKNPDLKGWQRLFVSTLQRSAKPGRKQIEKLHAIAAQLGYSLSEEGGEA